MIGQTLAHYRITAAIGAGGMGEVYQATDTRLGRQVALKVLPADMARDPERLERFQREARAVAAINDPHIVTIHSVEQAEGVHFLTMELVEGQPLDRVIPRGGLPVDRLLAVASAIADALSAAHAKGIVHRDLKPANVMVTAEGSVKVLDFGLAKFADEGARAEADIATALQTRDGMVMGTVPYMSPEQIAGRPVDHRTDIFSLGVILYEMAGGQRPFHGTSSAELASAILRDTPPSICQARADLPQTLGRVIERCLEKSAADRFASSRDLRDRLRGVTVDAPMASTATRSESRPVVEADSGAARADDGFWVAVLPFKYTGASPDLATLAEGLSEEIVTGLSRFSYLHVIARGSALRQASESADVRAVGTQLGARYVMEGSLRQAGAMLRVAVQLVDTTSGAHLWAETYNRAFVQEGIFALQDDLVPRIVSTVADMDGILPHSMADALRAKSDDQLSPHEAVLRSFSFLRRITPEEHAQVRQLLERVTRSFPDHGGCWAMLSALYIFEYRDGFGAQPDPLGRAFAAARRAVDVAPSSHLSHWALATALFFRRELAAFRPAAERAIELNRMDGSAIAWMGHMIAFSGDWDRGCAIASDASTLNPHHAGWHRFLAFYSAYRKGEYRNALDAAVRLNMPGYFNAAAALAAAFGQLGDREASQRAVKELLDLRPDYAEAAREEFEKYFDAELVEHLVDGLRKAGLAIPASGDRSGPDFPDVAQAAPRDVAQAFRHAGREAVAIAVLPFSDMSPTKDQEYLCEGMAEEIMNALVRIDGIRVASRTSAFRARHDHGDLPAIARALSVGHVLEGSVRTSGSRLRVTAQLTDVTTGYQLWSERFDRDAADVFAVQDEIAAGVVEAVKSRLAPGERTVRVRSQAHNLEAYRCYLKARHLRYAKEDYAGALGAFEEAVRLDSSHAPSWTGLAEILALAAHMNVIPPGAACASARSALATAARLQGESADGCHVEGFIALIERRWDAMETAWQRAIVLQPTHVQALGSFGIALCARQKLNVALPLFERARQADPLGSFPYMITGGGLLNCGQPEEAERYFEDALSFEKEDASALFLGGMAKVALGKFEEGIALSEHAVAVSRRAAHFLGVLGWALATAGRKDEARTILDDLRTRPAASPALVAEAWLLGALGEIDAAFALLGRAEEECQALLCYTGWPGFDPLRADPRFNRLLERLALR